MSMARRINDHTTPPLPPGPAAPPHINAELHYLYSLLTFSDAHIDPATMRYTPGTGCGRLTYQRDGTPWILVIRPDDDGTD
jgi:hypothetical protein